MAEELDRKMANLKLVDEDVETGERTFRLPPGGRITLKPEVEDAIKWFPPRGQTPSPALSYETDQETDSDDFVSSTQEIKMMKEPPDAVGRPVLPGTSAESQADTQEAHETHQAKRDKGKGADPNRYRFGEQVQPSPVFIDVQVEGDAEGDAADDEGASSAQKKKKKKRGGKKKKKATTTAPAENGESVVKNDGPLRDKNKIDFGPQGPDPAMVSLGRRLLPSGRLPNELLCFSPGRIPPSRVLDVALDFARRPVLPGAVVRPSQLSQGLIGAGLRPPVLTTAGAAPLGERVASGGISAKATNPAEAHGASVRHPPRPALDPQVRHRQQVQYQRSHHNPDPDQHQRQVLKIQQQLLKTQGMLKIQEDISATVLKALEAKVNKQAYWSGQRSIESSQVVGMVMEDYTCNNYSQVVTAATAKGTFLKEWLKSNPSADPDDVQMAIQRALYEVFEDWLKSNPSHIALSARPNSSSQVIHSGRIKAEKAPVPTDPLGPEDTEVPYVEKFRISAKRLMPAVLSIFQDKPEPELDDGLKCNNPRHIAAAESPDLSGVSDRRQDDDDAEFSAPDLGSLGPPQPLRRTQTGHRSIPGSLLSVMQPCPFASTSGPAAFERGPNPLVSYRKRSPSAPAGFADFSIIADVAVAADVTAAADVPADVEEESREGIDQQPPDPSLTFELMPELAGPPPVVMDEAALRRVEEEKKRKKAEQDELEKKRREAKKAQALSSYQKRRELEKTQKLKGKTSGFTTKPGKR
jgi:hypothetical protein